MSDLTDALTKVEGEHATALQWFRDHAGSTVAWSEIKDYVNKGARLVNQAKGIYKPHYTDYALSVRQTLDGPYADSEVERRPDGSWVYSYFQENPNPSERDKEATNRGLMKCLEDGIPIGVLLQSKPKPGVAYDVLGVAVVTEWKNGYFILEGFSNDGTISATHSRPDAAHDRARAVSAPLFVEDFNPTEIGDGRDRQMAEVVRRRGQSKFRAELMTAYGARCVISDCDAPEALEAAHIAPYRGAHSNHAQNGLLLRADLHSLFDLGLVSIDPADMSVVLSAKLQNTSYVQFGGRRISKPIDASCAPNAEALAQHLRWTGIVR